MLDIWFLCEIIRPMNEQNVIRKWFKLSKEAGVFSFQEVFNYDDMAYTMVNLQLFIPTKKGGRLYDYIRYKDTIVQNLKPEDQDEMKKVFEERERKHEPKEA
jgi:hypothetical protein